VKTKRPIAGIKMKFCAALDHFVRIRRLDDEQLAALLDDANLTDSASYRRLVVSATVCNYLTDIAPRAFGNDDLSIVSHDIEQGLYELAIIINPELNMQQVTIHVNGDDTQAAVAMLGTSPATPILKSHYSNHCDSERYLRMERVLSERLVGQEDAITQVASVIRKAKAGLKAPYRPLGCFLFVGQTGVGKTELARCLARFLFESENKLIRIDCSEYAQGHEYAKLIGAPPGYIGHDNGGYLTEAIRSSPGQVVVLDEIEKAHPKVHNLLLQVFDEGVLTDSRGQVVSFSEAVVILTSNLGVEELERLSTSIGFSCDDIPIVQEQRITETRKALERTFPPEFLNRIDEVITFRPLGREALLQVLSILLEEVAERVRAQGMTLSFSPRARAFLIDNGTDPRYGARPLKRAIRRFVENPLADLILSGRMEPSAHITCGYRTRHGRLSFNVKK